MSTTRVSGLNSLRPNSGGGSKEGDRLDSKRGPLPRSPYPHTYTSPLSGTQEGKHSMWCVLDGVKLEFRMNAVTRGRFFLFSEILVNCRNISFAHLT